MTGSARSQQERGSRAPRTTTRCSSWSSRPDLRVSSRVRAATRLAFMRTPVRTTYDGGPMRVLGIDPGLTRCGVGVVEGEPGRPLRLVDVNVVRTSAELPVAQRLVSIERALDAWIEEHRPDAVAVERVFARSDVSTVMGTAQASGIALVCAARRGLTVAMPTASEVKA